MFSRKFHATFGLRVRAKITFFAQVLRSLFGILTIQVILPGLPLSIQADSSKTAQGQDTISECVVLLHGLGRTYWSMQRMAQTLEAAGFRTVNLDYPSRKHSIEKLAMEVIPEGIQRCHAKGTHTIHFVTHSMGGIVLRYYLSKHTIEGLGRVVMLSPPNQGSEVTDALQDTALHQWYYGPAGRQLSTGPDSLVAQLGPVYYPVGVITGNEHAFFDAWFSGLIPGQDDGKVSVESSKVEGMTDFLVLPYAHPYIMQEEEVMAQTIYFLSHGRFRGTDVHFPSPFADILTSGSCP